MLGWRELPDVARADCRRGARGISCTIFGAHVTESLTQLVQDYERQCPGEAYTISNAVCHQRQKRHYPKCPGCQWNALAMKAVVEAAAGNSPEAHSQLHEVSMIEKVY